MELNRLETAKSHLLKAIDEDPDNALAYNALALLYEKLERFGDAESSYQSAYDIAPEDFSILNNYGRYKCEHGDVKQGMAWLVKAGTSRLNLRPWLALTNAGRCQLSQGKAKDAEVYFRKALEVNESYAPALAAMQKLSYEQSKYWPAKAFLARYLQVAENTPETLYIAFQTERALGNFEQANLYKQQLRDQFPTSSESIKALKAQNQ